MPCSDDTCHQKSVFSPIYHNLFSHMRTHIKLKWSMVYLTTSISFRQNGSHLVTKHQDTNVQRRSPGFPTMHFFNFMFLCGVVYFYFYSHIGWTLFWVFLAKLNSYWSQRMGLSGPQSPLPHSGPRAVTYFDIQSTVPGRIPLLFSNSLSLAPDVLLHPTVQEHFRWDRRLYVTSEPRNN